MSPASSKPKGFNAWVSFIRHIPHLDVQLLRFCAIYVSIQDNLIDPLHHRAFWAAVRHMISWKISRPSTATTPGQSVSNGCKTLFLSANCYRTEMYLVHDPLLYGPGPPPPTCAASRDKMVMVWEEILSILAKMRTIQLCKFPILPLLFAFLRSFQCFTLNPEYTPALIDGSN